jgi:hypothetical protein
VVARNDENLKKAAHRTFPSENVGKKHDIRIEKTSTNRPFFLTPLGLMDVGLSNGSGREEVFGF